MIVSSLHRGTNLLRVWLFIAIIYFGSSDFVRTMAVFRVNRMNKVKKFLEAHLGDYCSEFKSEYFFSISSSSRVITNFCETLIL